MYDLRDLRDGEDRDSVIPLSFRALTKNPESLKLNVQRILKILKM